MSWTTGRGLRGGFGWRRDLRVDSAASRRAVAAEEVCADDMVATVHGHVTLSQPYIANICHARTMADVAHKAHRPAQSGAKADKKRKPGSKDKQAGTNEKVLNFLTVSRSGLTTVCIGLCTQVRQTCRSTGSS